MGLDDRGGVGIGFTSGTMPMKSGIQAGTSFWTLGTLPSDEEDEEMSASSNPGRLEESLKFSMHSSTCGSC